jgi:hypothetical protein
VAAYSADTVSGTLEVRLQTFVGLGEDCSDPDTLCEDGLACDAVTQLCVDPIAAACGDAIDVNAAATADAEGWTLALDLPGAESPDLYGGCGPAIGGAASLFTFTSAEPGSYIITTDTLATADADGDTVLWFYEGDCLDQIVGACSDDITGSEFTSAASRVLVTLGAGETVTFGIESYFSGDPLVGELRIEPVAPIALGGDCTAPGAICEAGLICGDVSGLCEVPPAAACDFVFELGTPDYQLDDITWAALVGGLSTTDSESPSCGFGGNDTAIAFTAPYDSDWAFQIYPTGDVTTDATISIRYPICDDIDSELACEVADETGFAGAAFTLPAGVTVYIIYEEGTPNEGNAIAAFDYTAAFP